MKYFTKEWYNKMQCTSLHLLLKVSKKAENFSEEFYKKLYDNAKKRYIKQNSYLLDYEKFKKVQFEILDDGEQLTEEEIQEEFKRRNEETFNGKSIEEVFLVRQNHRIEDLKSKLPTNILDKVKDIRVLALDYVSLDVYKLIKEYSEYNKKFVHEKIQEYSKLEEKEFKNVSLDFLKESFHDCFIENITKDEKNLIINLDNEYGFTDKSIITFTNYSILLNENIENSWWLYNEIYKNNNKYEIHILVSRECGLKELIIECDDITLK